MIASNQFIREINHSYREIFLNAVSRNDIGTVESLLSNSNAQLRSYDFEIDPVHICVSRNFLDLLELLLTAEFSATRREGVLELTPLMNAVLANNKYLVESLLKFSCGVNLQDALGETALHKAALSSDTKESIFTMLLKNGADNSVLDQQDKNPGYWAQLNVCKYKGLEVLNQSVAQLLVKAAAQKQSVLKYGPPAFVVNPQQKVAKVRDEGLAKHKLFKEVKPKPPKGVKKAK